MYKFYTGENTQDMIYKAHLGLVSCLHWLDDDSGFISGGWDGYVYTWKLQTDKRNDQELNNPRYPFALKNFQFACVANNRTASIDKPEAKTVVFASGIDKTIKKIEQGVEVQRYDAGANISQIQLMRGGRAIFAGIAENDRPGSIQVIRFPFERIFEIQAHSLPIERLRVSHDNQHLYSAGQDGMFGIFTIVDKDPSKKDKEYSQITQSDEILIEKQEQDKYVQDIDHLRNQIEIEKQKKEASVQQELERKQRKIDELNSDIENKKIENDQRYEQLLDAKREMEQANKDRLRDLTQAHEIEMERRKQDYTDKMDADQQRFNELQQAKDEDARKFEERLSELTLHHEKIIKELDQDQKIDLDR